MRIPLLTALAAACMALPLHAADPKPEIDRPVGTPQSDGAVHTLRVIPEACARLEGRFTGDAAKPYDFAAVRTSERCQPRARLVDAAKSGASAKAGWILNDVIRVPRVACASQQAVVRVWRKPGTAGKPPALDAQGRARLYLRDADGGTPEVDREAIPAYAAAVAIEGKPCR